MNPVARRPGAATLAVFTEDDLVGFINGDRIAIFVKGEHALGAQDDVVGCFGQRAGFQCSTTYRIAQDFALELGSEGLCLLSALADGLKLFIVVTAQRSVRRLKNSSTLHAG